MTDRKKPTAGFWITVALAAVLVGYPLWYGPWCWLNHAVTIPPTIKSAGHEFFKPCAHFYLSGRPEPIWGWYVSYIRWCADIGDHYSGK